MVSGGPSGPAQGQQQYTTPGTYTWVAPAGVTSICVVCVGGGAGNTSNFNAGGGGGGALAWDNNIAVTAGSSYTIVVGAGGVGSIDPEGNAGGNSSFSVGPVRANGGGSSGSAWAGGTTFGGDGGGNGGDGKISNLNGSGGGAGGYTGVGGKGATRFETPTAGAGGAGGGGWAGDITYNEDGSIYINYGGGGGGVGLLGQGSNGFAAGSLSGGGGGGSGGGNAGLGGGPYGGGGGFGSRYIDPEGNVYPSPGADGAGGAVRIIWGPGRSFPSTNTGNV